MLQGIMLARNFLTGGPFDGCCSQQDSTWFLPDAMLAQGSGRGEFDFVTIVEWQNGDAVEGARKAVVAIHQRMILMRKMISRLGILADIANYKRVELAMAAQLTRGCQAK
jgi:hypothetical protein